MKMFAMKMPVAKMSMAKTDTPERWPGLLLILEQEQVQWILIRDPDLLRKGD